MIALAREVLYVDIKETKGPFFLAADIGGTNSNFGIFSLAHKPELILSLHYKSKDIVDFAALVNQVLTYVVSHYAITIERSCIAAAGIIYPHRVYARPTNLSFEINTNDLLKLTALKSIFLINDFEAVALGIELLDPKDIITINKGVSRVHANRAFIGAGTGLGKSIALWQYYFKRYFPVASEGGHADVAVYTKQEFELLEYIQKHYYIFPVSWEHILSGAGIQRIYSFLGTQKKYKETSAAQEISAHDLHPDRISYYATQDEQSLDTFDIYTRFYARCAKNVALETVALNGLYIAGGIASKNISLFFEPCFMQEFQRCEKLSKHLASIPVYIIANYNVSLYGAVIADSLYRQDLL